MFLRCRWSETGWILESGSSRKGVLPRPEHGDSEEKEDGVFEPREARLACPSGRVAVGIIV